MTFGSKPKGSRFVDWKSTLIPVIPAEAGIQVVFEREPKTNLDAGPEFILSASKGQHDELALHLKPALSKVEGVRGFNHPRERHQEPVNRVMQPVN